MNILLTKIHVIEQLLKHATKMFKDSEQRYEFIFAKIQLMFPDTTIEKDDVFEIIRYLESKSFRRLFLGCCSAV